MIHCIRQAHAKADLVAVASKLELVAKSGDKGYAAVAKLNKSTMRASDKLIRSATAASCTETLRFRLRSSI